MCERASRNRARLCDHRALQATYHRTQLGAETTTAPKMGAKLPAQGTQGPTSGCARADVVWATLTRAARLATRSPLCAKRSTGARGSAGQGSASPMGLPQSYPGGAPEGDSNSVPVSTAERSRHRTRHAVTTRREAASRSAAAPTCSCPRQSRTGVVSRGEHESEAAAAAGFWQRRRLRGTAAHRCSRRCAVSSLRVGRMRASQLMNFARERAEVGGDHSPAQAYGRDP